MHDLTPPDLMDYDVLDEGEDPHAAVDDILPASTAVTLFVEYRGYEDNDGERGPDAYLCVGWDRDGSPVVMGKNGQLRLLSDDETVTDSDW